MSSPTVVPSPYFNPDSDAQILRKAMKGFGTDEPPIIEVLTGRSNAQRQEIAWSFNKIFQRDLIKDLKSETSGNFRELLVGMMTPPVQYLCEKLYNAMKGMGTDESALNEILCTKTKSQINEISRMYADMYNRPLVSDINGDTSGDYGRLLTFIVTGVRDENGTINYALAKSQAQDLYNAGEGRWGTNESVFNKIMTHASLDQLRLIFEEYKQIAGNTIENAINKEMSGNLKKAMLTIVEYAQSPEDYFAIRLYKSMKGLGTDDRTLVRIIVSRAEIDLGAIKRAYERLYNRTLISDVKGDCSGDYKKTLLALIGGV